MSYGLVRGLGNRLERDAYTWICPSPGNDFVGVSSCLSQNVTQVDPAWLVLHNTVPPSEMSNCGCLRPLLLVIYPCLGHLLQLGGVVALFPHESQLLLLLDKLPGFAIRAAFKRLDNLGLFLDQAFGMCTRFIDLVVTDAAFLYLVLWTKCRTHRYWPYVVHVFSRKGSQPDGQRVRCREVSKFLVAARCPGIRRGGYFGSSKGWDDFLSDKLLGRSQRMVPDFETYRLSKCRLCARHSSSRRERSKNADITASLFAGAAASLGARRTAPEAAFMSKFPVAAPNIS